MVWLPVICGGRRTVLETKANRDIYLRERQHLAAACDYGHEKWLPPNSITYDFPSTLYKDRNRDFDCASTIVVFAGEQEALDTLTPEIFVKYDKLIFLENEATNELIVQGYPASLMDWLRGLVYPRRDYSGRSMETVLQRQFKVNISENEDYLPSFQVRKINIFIDYGGKWNINEQGGCIWSRGANPIRQAISVDENNLTLEVVVDEICETLRFNGSKPKLVLSYLPVITNCDPWPVYILDSKSLKTYLSFGNDSTRPILKVEIDEITRQ